MSDVSHIDMDLCAFCGGPPMVHVGRLRKRFEPVKRWPRDGIYLDAYVWCHECGAQGPRVDDSACCDEDVHALQVKAIEEWNRRDQRHADMFEHSVREGLNRFPRS